MEAFYSILYYKTNPLTDEIIAIGLFCGGGEGPFFFLSENRMRLVKNVIHNNSFLALKRNVLALDKSIYQYRNNSKDLMLFDPNYTKELFQKLNKKSKGALVYSAPTTINDWMTSELFNELVFSFLGESSSNKKSRKKTPFHVKWRSVKKANRFKHMLKDIPVAEISTLSDEIIIDLFDQSVNKAFKGLDFDLSEKSFKLKINEIKNLLNQLSFELVLIAPRPKTKLGRQRKEEFRERNNQTEILSLEEFMNHYK